MSGYAAATGLLAQTEPEPSAGSIGLLIIVLLFLATIFLVRNMSGRLKRLPKSFDRPDASEPPREGKADPPPTGRR